MALPVTGEHSTYYVVLPESILPESIVQHALLAASAGAEPLSILRAEIKYASFE